MKNNLIIFCLVLTVFSTSVPAQLSAPKETPVLQDATNGNAPEDFSVGEVKGTINNKAIYLAKPAFSKEARQAGAEGAVRVKIVIGEEGTVISANMIAGEALLKTSAEDAAKKSKFRIARDANGNPVSTEGILNYNFVIQKANWSRIGYSLSLLERLPVAGFPMASARKAFAPEWSGELLMLEKLEEIRRSEPEFSTNPLANAPKPVLSKITPNGNYASQSTIARRLNVPPMPSAEQIALSQNLISSLSIRLGNDDLKLWQFNLGLELRRALEIQRNPNTQIEAEQIIRQNIEKAPEKVSREVIAALESIAQIFGRGERNFGSPTELGKYLGVIFNSK